MFLLAAVEGGMPVSGLYVFVAVAFFMGLLLPRRRR